MYFCMQSTARTSNMLQSLKYVGCFGGSAQPGLEAHGSRCGFRVRAHKSVSKLINHQYHVKNVLTRADRKWVAYQGLHLPPSVSAPGSCSTMPFFKRGFNGALLNATSLLLWMLLPLLLLLSGEGSKAIFECSTE